MPPKLVNSDLFVGKRATVRDFIGRPTVARFPTKNHYSQFWGTCGFPKQKKSVDMFRELIVFPSRLNGNIFTFICSDKSKHKCLLGGKKTLLWKTSTE